jgi:alanine dehydrogenase
VARTSTFALTNATIGYALELASKGVVEALRQSRPLLLGLNAAAGHLTYEAAARSLGRPHVAPEAALAKLGRG